MLSSQPVAGSWYPVPLLKLLDERGGMRREFASPHRDLCLVSPMEI